MYKKLLILLLIGIFSFLPIKAFAQDSRVIDPNPDCIDLEAIYKEINITSTAVTGVENSIDAVKKVNTVASMMNVMSLFVGDQIYCVKDQQAAAQSNSLKNSGFLGMVSDANNAIFAMYPDISVTTHLAEMFVPGYQKNSINALPIDLDPDDPVDSTTKKVSDYVEKGIEDSAEEMINSIEMEELEFPEEPAVQSSGYNYLKDVVKLDALWKVSISIVYVLFVVIFIVVGFMIMFRKNLGSNATVTISRALPNLIVSLVLVTFSFAIVGLVMDIGKVGINVSRTMFEQAYKEVNAPSSEVIEIKNVWNLADDVFKKTRENTAMGDAVSDIPIVGKLLSGVLFGTGNSIGWELARVAVMGGIYYFLDKPLPEIINEADVGTDLEVEGSIIFVSANFDILQPIVDLVLWGIKSATHIASTTAKISLMAIIIKSLILIILSFYAAIRVFITLLTTYLKLFLNVVFGPFQILAGSIPGNSHHMTNWFKSVVANTLVFVGVFVVINTFNLIAQVVDPTKFNFFGNSGVLWPDIIISLEAVIVIAGYLFAASLPKVINGLMGVEANRSVVEATRDMKESAKKVPLIGGVFN